MTLTDRRTFGAEVVGFDSLIDIALLKIEAQLPHVRLGDSTSLQVGDWVLAIGHPLGMGSTLTHGIISAQTVAPISLTVRATRSKVLYRPTP